MREGLRGLVPLLLLLLPLWASGAGGQTGGSAEIFFRSSGVRDVQISPRGDWLVAHAVRGETHSLLAQPLGAPEWVAVFSTHEPLYAFRWIGGDRLLIFFERREPGAALVGRLRQDESGPVLEQEQLDVPGGFVAPLPLVDDTLVWWIRYQWQSRLHRVTVRDLLEYGGKRDKGYLVLGETLAKVRGTAVRWVVDRAGAARAVLVEKRGEYTLLARDDSGEFRPVHHFREDAPQGTITPLAISPDGKSLLVLAYGKDDTLGVHRFDLASGRLVEKVFGREDVDILDVLLDPIDGDPVAAVYEEGGRRRIHHLEAGARERFASLRSELGVESLAVVSRSADGASAVLLASGARNPGAYYLRSGPWGRLSRLARVQDQLEESDLSRTETLEVTSRDGTLVEAFLTLPARRRGRPAPLVVNPHGGPIGVADSGRFDPLAQYLASWGFATLKVNYRGSSGYGLRFEEAGRRQWAQGIEDDIDAAVERVMARPEIDEDRICIVGGSYGGFSALASVIRHERRYRCAATLNGVTDIPLSFQSSDFADDARSLERFAADVGDVRTDREQLVSISPVYHVDRIQTPLWVAYGTEDRRVDPDHSHRLLLMLELFGKQHESLELEGATHWLTEPQWIEAAQALRRFLTQHLLPGATFQPDPDLAPQG